MMKVVRSPRFDRAYKKLPEEVKKVFSEKMKLLAQSKFNHPSLRMKKIKGTGYIWEASIDLNHRFTFEKIKNGIKLRVIGKHNILDKP
jgi:mRNA interferase RelE/StbE